MKYFKTYNIHIIRSINNYSIFTLHIHYIIIKIFQKFITTYIAEREKVYYINLRSTKLRKEQNCRKRIQKKL